MKKAVASATAFFLCPSQSVFPFAISLPPSVLHGILRCAKFVHCA
ncbi:hypothetical protein [Azospirillum argentinense]